MNLKTLKGLNNARHLSSSTYAVGVIGHGGKTHLIFIDAEVQTACNSQAVAPSGPSHLDLKDINCVKCKKVLDRIKENLREDHVQSHQD